MLTNYFSGLDKNERKEAESDYKQAHAFRSRMSKLIQKQVDSEFQSMVNEEDFDPVKQAQRVAMIKSYKKMLNMLK